MIMFDLLLHPFTLTVALIISFLIVKDLIVKGFRLSKVHRCIDAHLEAMSKKRVDQAWDSLSFDLRTTLTNQKRLKKGGKSFFGKKRVEMYAFRFNKLYQEGRLIIESVHKVRSARSPKIMYMIRLRSRATGYIRMTIWISRVPLRQDHWSIDEICVHPQNGDTNKGETLTGARMRRRPTRSAKGKQDQNKGRGRRSLAKAS
jgi:hypothetical protein